MLPLQSLGPRKHFERRPLFWFKRDISCIMSPFPDGSAIPHFVRISPAGSDARKAAQLAEKTRSLYTGKTFQSEYTT
jgi:hypothetical protein